MICRQSLREGGTAVIQNLSIKSPVPITKRPHHTEENQLSVY